MDRRPGQQERRLTQARAWCQRRSRAVRLQGLVPRAPGHPLNRPTIRGRS
jgi:hypothetical protein